ncbi:MAG: [FeFe] hydrogenase H-cluster radical SAM maturase HydE [Erysipelotrichales bacterium]
MKYLIDKLEKDKVLTKEEFVTLIENRNVDLDQYLFDKAVKVRKQVYDDEIYLRGLLEFTNYCKNDCYYCGIRKSNLEADRYRLSKEQILECCESGYELGYRTFVLQGGEDPYYTDEMIVDIVTSIKAGYPDCAITLGLGEKSYESCLKFYNAGADRYLLRHESINSEHYNMLHPKEMSIDTRKETLYNLKEIGFEVGCGFMVGSPYQKAEHLAEDMLFILDLQPQMVGIGPYLSHQQTPFADKEDGSLELTLFMLGMLRLMLPNTLLPASTALGTANPKGRERGILSGANVVMPNLSPTSVRDKYLLYDNKICTGDEAAECRGCIESRMNSIGYNIVVDRGDSKLLIDK